MKLLGILLRYSCIKLVEVNLVNLAKEVVISSRTFLFSCNEDYCLMAWFFQIQFCNEIMATVNWKKNIDALNMNDLPMSHLHV